MKIAICDDAPMTQSTLKKFCMDAGESDITLFSCGEDVLAADKEFDLLFLDIEMKGISGIEVMRRFEMSHSHMMIVFCTAHPEQSVETHGRNVIGFLTKPASFYEVERYIKKTRKLSACFQIIHIDNQKNLICRDIVYIKAASPYTYVYTKDGVPYISSNSLSKWISILETLPFHKISRSYLVNFQNIHEISHHMLILTTGEKLSISRRLNHDITKKYSEYRTYQML